MEDLADDIASVVAAAPLAALPVGGVAVRMQSQQELSQDRLKSIEDELLEEAMSMTRHMLAFSEIDPGDVASEKAALAKWSAELGPDVAAKRLRLARGSWMPGKDAPVGLKHASVLAVGIIRARATERGAPRSLNISIVQLTEQPMMKYPEREVDK